MLFRSPKVVEDSEADDEIMTTEDISENLQNENPNDFTDENLEIKQEDKSVTDIEDMTPPTSMPEEMPEFPGGDEALLKYIAENTNYSEEAKKMDIQGKVFVGFVVNKSGKVEQVHIKKGVDPLLDNEALRVIRSLPDFIPGKMGGHPVKVSMVVPIKFSLAQ